MRLKRILTDKSGIAVENAVLFMLLIFMLCTLLASLTLTGHYQTIIEKNDFLRNNELDQIGEDFLAGIKTEEALTNNYEEYEYEISGNSLTVWRKDDADKEVVLYVEAELDLHGDLIVRKWRYSADLPTY